MQDSQDPNPLIRALAVRTMGCIRVDKITEYLCDPLQRCLKVIKGGNFYHSCMIVGIKCQLLMSQIHSLLIWQLSFSCTMLPLSLSLLLFYVKLLEI